jgi:hypothetical protein
LVSILWKQSGSTYCGLRDARRGVCLALSLEEVLMAITYRIDSTTGEGTFIRVLRDGQPFGKILDAVGIYRFYEADDEKLRGAALQDANLERLKTAIQSKYEGRIR